MNNIFSFERFLKVLKYDLKMRVPAVFTSFLAFLAIPHALHVVMSFGQTFPVAQRVDLYSTMAAFLMFFAPFTIYSSFNNKQGKSGFLMLPASALEKFTSMVAVSMVLLPVSFIFCTLILDLILVLLFNDCYGTVVSVDFMKLLRGGIAAFSIIGAALLGNVTFKKKASAKTILCLLALMILWGFGVTDMIFEKLLEDGNADAEVMQATLRQLNNITAIAFGTAGVLFYILTYWRIKKMQIS